MNLNAAVRESGSPEVRWSQSAVRHPRRGFTLVELLVVIGIIMLLAGMGFGVFTMVRNQAKLTQCTNNLQNLGVGIKGFQLEDRKGGFPTSLTELFTAGMPLSGASITKTLVCPFDPNKGSDPSMGRPLAWSGGLETLNYLHENGSSYLYEISSTPLHADHVDWFYGFPGSDATPAAPAAMPTWAEGKTNVLINHPSRYRRSAFPIIRDFHHFNWSSEALDSKVKKVFNLTWDLSVLWTVPWWEQAYQP